MNFSFLKTFIFNNGILNGSLNLRRLTFSFGLLLIPIIILLVLYFNPNLAIAETTKSESSLVKQIEELKKKIETTKSQAESLSREINIIEQNVELKTIQIKQAEYQIEQKEKELADLIDDIELLEVRLDRLDETMESHQDLLGLRLKKHYIEKQNTPFAMLISSVDLSDFMAKIKYLQEIEAQDAELLKKMNSTKGNYEEQQDLLEQKKEKVEKIKREIEDQKSQAEDLKQSLEQQKQQKDSLLRVTKNNEQKYKDLLKDAERELQQIQSAANVVIREGAGVKVKKGEVVGTMGNSGFSTGAHLHFGVYKYSAEDFVQNSNWGWYYKNYDNPVKYLKSKNVIWDTGCYRDPKGEKATGEGDWDWPMSKNRITQNYGSSTCYNWMYGGRPHPALDIVGIGDISVKAVEDGEAYFCRNCLKDGGNGVFIFHEDGRMSLYWHLK